MDFSKGTKIEDIFNTIIKAIDKSGVDASKRIYDIFKTAPKEFKSGAIRSMTRIKETLVLDCGCCYKLNAPAMDMIMSEVAGTRATLDDIRTMLKEGRSSSEILDMMDRDDAVLHTVQTGLREIVSHDYSTGVDSYRPTMELYAKTYHMMHPGEIKGLFDHIIGLEASIRRAIEENEPKKETAE